MLARAIFGTVSKRFRWNLTHGIQHDISCGLKRMWVRGIYLAVDMLIGHLLHPAFKRQAAPGGLRSQRLGSVIWKFENRHDATPVLTRIKHKASLNYSSTFVANGLKFVL